MITTSSFFQKGHAQVPANASLPAIWETSTFFVKISVGFDNKVRQRQISDKGLMYSNLRVQVHIVPPRKTYMWIAFVAWTHFKEPF